MGVQASLDRFYAFLGQPMYLRARPLLLVLVAPLLLALTQPLWHIQLEAPQYPQGLTVDIHAHTITSGHGDKDLREINILNHYVGMKKIERSAFADLDWLPFAFAALAVFALRVAAIGDVRALLDLAVLTAYVAAFSGARFIYKLYVYGHELSPDAPVKVDPFMPAVLGSKTIGNFTTQAFPGAGAYLFGAFVTGVLGLAAFHLIAGRRQATRVYAAGMASANS